MRNRRTYNQHRLSSRFKLLIRHPWWVPADKLKIVVGNDTLPSKSQPSAYYEIDRTWDDDETVVTVLLPMHTVVEECRMYLNLLL